MNIFLSYRNIWILPVVAAFILIVVSIFAGKGFDLSPSVSRRMEHRIDRRLDLLESYMQEVMDQNHSAWPQLKHFPEDMVIYRYVNDTLQSWCNQFTLDNDDISRRVYVQRFSYSRYSQVSPLAEVDTTYTYMNLGPEWYLVKSIMDGDGCRVIGGLEVRNTLISGAENGVNERLGLSDRFSMYPVSYSGGSTIRVKGRPLMKIIQENAQVMPLLPDTAAVWIAVLLILVGVLLYLRNHNSIRNMWYSIGFLTAFFLAYLLLSRTLRSSTELFSPTVYAGGSVLFSLGALLIINTWILGVVCCMFISRIPLLKVAGEKDEKVRMPVYGISIVALLIGLVVYTHMTFKSIIVNSNITLELYKVGELSRFTFYVYLSYSGLILSIVMLLQLLRPVLGKYYELHYSFLSRTGRVVASILGTVWLLLLSSVVGFQRESSRVDIWANRVAMDRNLGFELRLRTLEDGISTDPVVSTLLGANVDFRIILNRINENYLGQVSKDYDISLYMFRNDEDNENLAREYQERLRNGTHIAPGSRFLYSRTGSGRIQYTGVFLYNGTKPGEVITLLLGMESKANKGSRGYAAITGNNLAGNFMVPSRYSYAKYLDDKLISFQGEYAYPTVLSGRLKSLTAEVESSGHERIDGYLHFIKHISDDQYVLISRQKFDFTRYMVAGFMIFLLLFFVISIPVFTRRKKAYFERNYYKQRINSLLYVSLLATLVIMAVISVLFIYRRNRTNEMTLMSGKINTIQSLVESRARYLASTVDLATQDFTGFLHDIGDYTGSDISLYTTAGKAFNSTYPEMFENMYMGTRLDPSAYENIMYNNKRYYIHREKFGGHRYYSMYAPVFNSNGSMLAIAGAPYTDSGLNFRNEAVFHSFFIIALFFILLLLTRALSSAVVDKMFRPLVEMGKKMGLTRTRGLEYIYYDREDEISTLVRSYNRMVHDLSESSKQSAQLERDKAWSQMARQVAHEIKNPLTPIKLQIQRIIRLRAKNAPGWEEKFDSIVPVILESIDVLTDTANEFSTFAKLYSQESEPLDLDLIASGQVELFNDKDNISIEYYGLQNSWVNGPKPQLTRVFVNLLTNAVQAVENKQREDLEAGIEPVQGRVILSIRNSSREGFYDIVFEDNGPGVSDENRSRLFTPNFTTKSSGTGLGLAICKNILERCGAEITYGKSFSLGGACFSVRYPKGKVPEESKTS